MIDLLRRIFRKIMPHICRYVFGLKDIIIFKAHHSFKGNVHALYDYLYEAGYGNKYKFIWYPDTEEEYIPETALCIRRSSLKNNYYYKSCAKFIFYEDGCPVMYKTKGQKVVYLTHGCPSLKNSKGLVDVSIQKTTDALITSENVRSVMSKSRQFPEEKMFVCGHPRNDVIFNSPQNYEELFEKKYNKIIFWLPTFRKMLSIYDKKQRSDCDINYLYGIPLIMSEDDLEMLNKTLSKENIILIIKPHPGALKEGIENINYSNITVWSQEYLDKNNINYYRLFKNTDAFISDYSSVIFDAMLADKPLGYVIDDIDDYKLGYAFDNVLDYMPGHHIKTLEDMISFFEDVSQGKDIYKEKRDKISALVNTFPDGNNCKRIAEIFRL